MWSGCNYYCQFMVNWMSQTCTSSHITNVNNLWAKGCVYLQLVSIIIFFFNKAYGNGCNFCVRRTKFSWFNQLCPKKQIFFVMYCTFIFSTFILTRTFWTQRPPRPQQACILRQAHCMFTYKCCSVEIFEVFVYRMYWSWRSDITWISPETAPNIIRNWQ